MKTSRIVFPFNLFGVGGAGAALVADEFRETLADNRRETVVTRRFDIFGAPAYEWG